MEDRVLFECKTYYHLINILNIKYNLLGKDTLADLILTSDTNFSEIVNRIRSLNIFQNIYTLQYAGSVYGRGYAQLPYHKREYFFEHPEEYVEKVNFDPNVNYTDFYIALDDDYTKLFYYSLIKRGMMPAVHIFDEGSASYAVDYIDRIKKDSMNHSKYGAKAYPSNIKRLLLNDARLFAGPKTFEFPIETLPKICASNEVKEAMSRIWDNCILPNKKYIYLESGTFADGSYCTDLSLVIKIADIVGRENIAVKLHSRTKLDRFTKQGLFVLPKSTAPWEAYMLDKSIENKVLISNISTGSLTPQIMFGYNTKSIHLHYLCPNDNSLLIRQRSFPKMYDLLNLYYNEDGATFYAPKSFTELNIILRYLERGVVCEPNA